MADPSLEALIEHFMALTRLVGQQQGQIRALLAYVKEQPSADPERLAELLKVEQDHMERLRKAFLGEAEQIQRLLQDFEGRPQ